MIETVAPTEPAPPRVVFVLYMPPLWEEACVVVYPDGRTPPTYYGSVAEGVDGIGPGEWRMFGSHVSFPPGVGALPREAGP